MRIKGDLKYIILNCIVNRIPSWHLRRFLYSSMGLKIGKNARIGIKSIVVCPERIIIGNGTIVNEFCHLDGRGGLIIGDNSSISIYTKIITASHKLNSNVFEYICDRVEVGSNVWIGAGAIVLDGSRIENGSVIGAGCIFKGVAKEREVWVGNPARMIKKRTLDDKYSITYRPHFR